MTDEKKATYLFVRNEGGATRIGFSESDDPDTARDVDNYSSNLAETLSSFFGKPVGATPNSLTRIKVIDAEVVQYRKETWKPVSEGRSR